MHVHLLMGTLALGACGCGEEEEVGAPSAAPRGPDAADAFAGGEPVAALAMRVVLRDATPEAGGEAALGDDARVALEQLRRAPLDEQEWLLAGARVSLRSGASRIVLDEGAAAAIHGDGGGPLAPRLAHRLLEGGGDEHPRDTVLETRAPVADGEALGRPLRRQEFVLRARGEAVETAAQAVFQVWFANLAPAEAAQARLVMDLVGLTFLADGARRALHRPDAARGLPLRWRVAVRSERLAASATPVLEGEVVAIDRRSVPRSSFALAGSTAAVAPLPPRLTDRALLARLRALRVPAEAPGPLRVRNRTSWRLFALADGAVVGRVEPNSEATIDGLAPGYYRFYARTLYGSFHAGPRDLYVPGVITIDP
ncbi:MAG: hypothetical protein AABZ30_13345 [Myxococcota bacterium]